MQRAQTPRLEGTSATDIEIPPEIVEAMGKRLVLPSIEMLRADRTR